MRSFSLLSFVCLLVVLPVAGTATTNVKSIPLSADESRLEVTSQNQSELRFQVQVADLTALEVTTQAGVFHRLMIPGFHSSQREGAPELPMMNRLVAIPHGASARIEVEAVESRLIDLADFGIDTPLMPAQPSMSKSADPESWPFIYDPSAYQVDKVSQELVRIEDLGRLRAMDLGRVEVSPVEYYPRANQIRLTESVTFRVIFEGGDRAAGQELMTRTASPFFEPVYARVSNAKGFHDSYPDRVGDVVTMVIITPAMFETQLQDFVDWKTERGFHVIVGVIGTPEVGSSTSTIQSYIHDLYNNPDPGVPAPSFALFVGDVAQCPTFSMGGDATDRPYCAVDGDTVPDIYYGRFSATNSSQLQAILDKTLMYDQFTMPDPSYLAEVVMIAGVDAGYAPTHGNGQINYGTSNYFNVAHGITSHTYLYPASGSSGPQIISDVSNGVAYVNYTAHGSQTSWSDPSFTQSNVNGLGNSGEYCLAVGNCCLTSTYDYGECFAETWLRAVDKGAIGYIGGSNSTYWDEDFWWGVGYTSNINANPTFAGTEMGAYDGLFHDHGEAEHLWYVTNDAIIFCGNLAVMEAGSSLTTYYWNIYNLMGDPTLSTYLGVPAVNPVSYYAVSSASITVDAVPGSYVGLTQNGTLVGAGTVSPTGTEVISFFTTPAPGVDVHMVVTMQNREPYETDIALATPIIWLSDSSFSESLAPDAESTQYLDIGNTGESGSLLVYSVEVLAEAPAGPKGDKSIAGSTLTCGESEYLAGTTVSLGFTVYNASSDLEWLTDITIDFPSGVTVNSSTPFSGGSGGDMASNGATGNGVMVSWHGEDSSGWGLIYGGETATASVNVTFDGGLGGDVDLDYTLQGDNYGSTPHSLSGTMTLTAAGPSITVTSPDGGEELAIDAGTMLTWTSAGGLTDVKIDISRNAGTGWKPLVASTTNDGSYPWKVVGPTSTQCLIRVSSLDDSVSDTSDGVFIIYQPINWLSVIPASGELGQGGTHTLALDFDATGMAEGNYEAYIVITHNAAGSPSVLPVTLQVTGISAVGDTPLAFRFEGNHPNPFNPQTVLSFALPHTGQVSVDVLDLRGHRVRSLWNGSLEAGSHRLSWDGLDDRGQAVASGLYFAQVKTRNLVKTHKMILAR